ncbi:unnamed protein product [Arctogadus glacialis]
MGWDGSRRYEGCDEADGLQGPTAGDGSRCESQSWDNTRSPPRGEGAGVHTRSTAHVHGPPGTRGTSTAMSNHKSSHFLSVSPTSRERLGHSQTRLTLFSRQPLHTPPSVPDEGFCRWGKRERESGALPDTSTQQQPTEEGSVTKLFGEAIRFLHRK